MANDLNREAPRLLNDRTFFNQCVSTQAILRGLTEALVFDSSGRTIARSNLTFALQFEPIDEALLERARQGAVVLLTTDPEEQTSELQSLMRISYAVFCLQKKPTHQMTYLITAQSIQTPTPDHQF